MLDWCDDAGAIWTWTCLHIWCDNAKHTLMTVCKHALFVPWHPCVTHCKRNNISNSCKTVQLLKVFDDVWWTSFNSWKMSPTICTSYGHGFEKWCAPLFLVPEMAQNKAVQFTSPAQLRPCCTGLPGKDETKGSTGEQLDAAGCDEFISSQCPSETAAKKLTQILLESISAESCGINVAMENQHF